MPYPHAYPPSTPPPEACPPYLYACRPTPHVYCQPICLYISCPTCHVMAPPHPTHIPCSLTTKPSLRPGDRYEMAMSYAPALVLPGGANSQMLIHASCRTRPRRVRVRLDPPRPHLKQSTPDPQPWYGTTAPVWYSTTDPVWFGTTALVSVWYGTTAPVRYGTTAPVRYGTTAPPITLGIEIKKCAVCCLIGDQWRGCPQAAQRVVMLRVMLTGPG